MVADRYDHKSIEDKWQQRWLEEKVFSVPTTPAPLLEKEGTSLVYVLDMFPYPSGDGLHVGHPEGYTASDIFSRYLRMNGKKVLHPMGWDAFGLPAENAAIKKKTHPRIVTEQNIKNFKRQIQSIGFSYDWDREINTTDPKYYKWTQWIFLQLFKKGLAYEKESPIWWCPKDKTGLANEEVVNGCCERCGTPVEKKLLRQWVLKITAYAEQLLSGLDKLDWPESIKALQRNWIGKSEGAEVDFVIPVAKHAVLLHGFTGSPKANFFPWLMRELESSGMSVEVPALPNPDNPTVMEQVEYIEKHCTLDKDTVLFGRSLGVPVALKVIERLKHPIAKLVMASGFTAPVFEDHERPFASSFDWQFDWKKIHENVSNVVILHDTNDDAVGVKQAQSLEKAFNAPAQYVQSKEVHFCALEEPIILANMQSKVRVFTTRPDTLFGATYLVLSPEHPLVDEITTKEHKVAVAKYKKEVTAKSDLERTALEKEKTGVFTGAYAVNPVNQEKIPIWIADYALMTYGTGAIMAVPAHDERDFAFAKKFGLEIREVITTPAPLLGKEGASNAFNADGKMKNSGQYNGLSSEEGRQKIVAWLEKEGKAKPKVHYKLRDWIFSRQRYWGEPIPLVKCESCKLIVESTSHQLELHTADEWQAWVDHDQTFENAGLAKEVSSDKSHTNHYVKVTFGTTVGYWRVKQVKKNMLTLKHVMPGIILVPESELPLELPNVEKYEPTGTGESPLAAIEDWVNVTCRVCGHPAKRETNTMPQWAGSCWYYLRFTDPNNDTEFASAKALKAWLPVDLYVGGAEHAVLHLLYSRFWHKVLFDIGAIPPEVGDEPFMKLKNQGLILGPDGEKMSKSRGNVIGPDEIIATYGADTLRMYEMFMGPFEDAKPWDTNGIVGVRRFLDRAWRAGQLVSPIARTFESAPNSLASAPDGRTHRYTKLIGEGIVQFRFNTCVSNFMKWSNEWDTGIGRTEFEVFLKLLSPFAPHITEELWSNLGHKTILAQESWPKFDAKKIKEETVTIAVQVMGKLRGTLSLYSGASQVEVEKAAKADANVAKFLTGELKKVIFVKDKLINFVI